MKGTGVGLWASSSAVGWATSRATENIGVTSGDSRDIIVVSTTDVHGRIRGWDYYADTAERARGLTRAATIVDSVRAANPGRVVLLDAGDLLQGNPLTFVAARGPQDTINPIVAAMNVMA